MRILIDTHIWIWWFSKSNKLNDTARKLLAEPANGLHISVASLWEIAIKHSNGKLRLPLPPSQFVPQAMTEDRLIALPITSAHALEVSKLPMHHRDPFDRMLIAQAKVENLPILTADRWFGAYGITVIDAQTIP